MNILIAIFHQKIMEMKSVDRVPAYLINVNDFVVNF